jgi:hypothetical protein
VGLGLVLVVQSIRFLDFEHDFVEQNKIQIDFFPRAAPIFAENPTLFNATIIDCAQVNQAHERAAHSSGKRTLGWWRYDNFQDVAISVYLALGWIRGAYSLAPRGFNHCTRLD